MTNRADPFSIFPLDLDKRFLEITADIFYLIDLDGNLKSWNPSLERFCGLPPEKMKGRSCFDFVCEQDRPIVAADIQTVFASGFAASTYRFIRGDGDLIPFHCNGTVVFNDHGEPIGFAGLGRDISELQEKERQLHDAREEAESAARTIRKIASQVPGVIYQFRLRPDGSFCFPFASEAMREIFRIGPEEVREDASQVFARIHPDDYKGVVVSIQASARDLSLWHHEARVKFDDGTMRWLFGNAIPQREADDSVLWHGFITDITKRKQDAETLRQSEIKFRTLFDSTTDAVMLLNEKGFFDCNNATLSIFGCATQEEFCSKHPADLSPQEQRCGTSSLILSKQHIAMAMERGSHSFEWMHKRFDTGKPFFADVLLSAMELDGKQVLQAVVRDITARKSAEEQIKNLAFYDTLTQLPNRRLLNDRIRQAIAASKRNGCYCALMFMDLDNFKPLNDAHGHGAGDLLLIEAARRIISCVREVDTVARFGGDEFVVLLSELDENKAESTAQTGIIAEKIRATLAEPYLLELQQDGKNETTIEHHCTSSIGVVLFIKDEASTENIIKSADLAMYQAKNDGRNLIRFFDPKS